MPSKSAVVATWLQASGHDPRRVLMVGDTNHDEEIASDLDVKFVRFSLGHQEPPDHDRYPVVHTSTTSFGTSTGSRTAEFPHPPSVGTMSFGRLDRRRGLVLPTPAVGVHRLTFGAGITEEDGSVAAGDVPDVDGSSAVPREPSRENGGRRPQ